MKKLSVGVAFATLAFAGAASAQTYPTRPITMIVPYGAGGPVDVLARLLIEPMRQSLGQPIVIENVTGANGTIGVGKAVRSPPDGYTVSIGNWPSHITNGAIYNLNYDIQRDFEPVARLVRQPLHRSWRARTCRPRTSRNWSPGSRPIPDKATQGTAGVGSGQHISGVYFQKVTGTKFQFVPYKTGSAEIIRDIIAGHIDLSFDQAITALSACAKRRVKAFAVTSDKRLEAAPDIPTVDEAGAPGVYILTWYGMWLPKGSPKEAIEKIGDAARAALADPAVRRAARHARPADSAARAANRGSARRLPESRDREVARADQGSRHQGGVRWT